MTEEQYQTLLPYIDITPEKAETKTVRLYTPPTGNDSTATSRTVPEKYPARPCRHEPRRHYRTEEDTGHRQWHRPADCRLLPTAGRILQHQSIRRDKSGLSTTTALVFHRHPSHPPHQPEPKQHREATQPSLHRLLPGKGIRGIPQEERKHLQPGNPSSSTRSLRRRIWSG